MSNLPVLHPEKSAAAVMRISARTLQGWRLRGGGPPYVKLGGRVLYRETDLLAWIESRARASTSEHSSKAA